MVLAAGRGKRLRPLSDERPKPLFPLGPFPILHYPLLMLRQAGVREVIMNLHHLGGQIRDRLGDGDALGLSIHYSEEQPELLGTGGGIKRARAFLEGEPFVLVNGDTISDVSLEAVLVDHARSGATATMVLVEATRDAGEFGVVAVDERSRVRDIAGRAGWRGRAARLGHFCGIHVVEPRIFDFMPDGEVFCINADVYPRLIAAGEHVHASFQAKAFWDVGTPARYLEAAEAMLDRRLTPAHAGGTDWLRAAGAVEKSRGVWFAPGAKAGREVLLRPPVYLGADARAETGARIGPYAVLGSASRVGAGSALAHTILWEGAEVAPGTAHARAVVTPLQRLQIPGEPAGSQPESS